MLFKNLTDPKLVQERGLVVIKLKPGIDLAGFNECMSIRRGGVGILNALKKQGLIEEKNGKFFSKKQKGAQSRLN